MSDLYDAWLELVDALFSLLDAAGEADRELAIWKVQRAGRRLRHEVSEITPETYPTVDAEALWYINEFAKDWGGTDEEAVRLWESSPETTRVFEGALRLVNDAVHHVRSEIEQGSAPSEEKPQAGRQEGDRETEDRNWSELMSRREIASKYGKVNPETVSRWCREKRGPVEIRKLGSMFQYRAWPE